MTRYACFDRIDHFYNLVTWTYILRMICLYVLRTSRFGIFPLEFGKFKEIVYKACDTCVDGCPVCRLLFGCIPRMHKLIKFSSLSLSHVFPFALLFLHQFHVFGLFCRRYFHNAEHFAEMQSAALGSNSCEGSFVVPWRSRVYAIWAI